MVPPQTGQFQSGTEWVWVEVCVAAICWGSPVLWNRWKQSGRGAAGHRLARKPKLRGRTKPRGGGRRRKRGRNSWTGGGVGRFLWGGAGSRGPGGPLLCARGGGRRCE